jgi:hypothetical protein
MPAPDKSKLCGSWITWPYGFSHDRGEFDLHEDGTFAVKMIHEGGQVFASAQGRWDIVECALQWTYQSCKGFARPRRPEWDKIISVEQRRRDGTLARRPLREHFNEL